MNPATPAYTLADRAELYNASWGKRYPGSCLRVANGTLSGLWQLGNDYRNRTPYYGAYPPRYLARVSTLFPDVTKVLHLFSGSLPASQGYVRFDLVAEADVKGDAHHLRDYFEPDSFDVIYADPPYNAKAAERYGTPMVNRLKVLNSCFDVLQPGGHLVWLDTRQPQVRKTRLKLVGAIGIWRSQNHDYRGVAILQKPREEIEPPDKLVNKNGRSGEDRSGRKGDDKKTLRGPEYTPGRRP
jgi:SAM-dependent methyltransferase